MGKKMNLIGWSVGALMAGAVSASAGVIDFTDAGTSLTGTVDGIGWTATGVPVAPNNSQDYDGGLPLPSDSFGGLSFDKDGWGIVDDEVASETQSITISFDTDVFITGFAFLDLFEQGTTGLGEFAIMTGSGGQEVQLSFDATNSANGYAEDLSFNPFTATSVTFTIGTTNDTRGVADGALAALEIAPVPVPAGGLLLLSALGGVAALRRRKKSS